MWGFGYFALSLGFIEIGNGLFQVILYGMLAQLQASGTLFGLGYAVAVIPALTGPIAGHKFGRLYGSFLPLILIAAAIAAMSALLYVFDLENQLPILFVLDLATSFFASFCGPVFQSAIRNKFSEQRGIRRASQVDVLILSSGTIFGLGLGSVFFDLLGPRSYLGIISCGYLLSAVLLGVARLADFRLFEYGGTEGALSLKAAFGVFRRSRSKQWVIALMPGAALVTVPLLTMLPAATSRLDWHSSLFATSPAVATTMMLFARSLGQVAGPFVALQRIIDKLTDNPSSVAAILSMFILLYGAAFYSLSLEVAFILVFAAHVLTNILFTASFFYMQLTFSEREIGPAFVLQNFVMTLIFFCGSLVSGLALDFFGIISMFVISLTSLVLLAIMGQVVWR